jgi:peptidoglycan/LPS O-acetylase OafA/YrhL
MNNSRQRLEFLDQLRGIAILTTLLFHTRLAAVASTPDLSPWHGLFRDFSHASLSYLLLYPLDIGRGGVAVFFVVSGFCIHLSFQQQGKLWRDFFIRRIFRICPAYLAALILFSSGLVFGRFCFDWSDGNLRLQFLTHLFFVHNFHPLTYQGVNSSFWSLAIEFQLYLLYPVLLCLAGMVGWRRVMLVLAGCELAIHAFNGFMRATGNVGGAGWQIADFLERSVFSFWFSWALGAWIADAFLKNKPLPLLKPTPILWLVLAVGGYFFRPLDPFWFTLAALTTAACISRLLTGTGREFKFPAFSQGILKKFGLWSYSLYLLNYPLLFLYKRGIEWIIPDGYHYLPVNTVFAFLTWALIIPLGILWYHVFEVPGIASSRRIIEKISGRGPARDIDGKNAKNTGKIITPKYCFFALILLVFLLGHLVNFSNLMGR